MRRTDQRSVGNEGDECQALSDEMVRVVLALSLHR